MIVNLGLVDLGGCQIDCDGYIFKFAEIDPSASQIRAHYALRKILNKFDKSINTSIELRVFINYDSPECLATATKLLVEHKYICESIVLLFESGSILRIK